MSAKPTMSRLSRNLSIILRAERMIARRHMAVLRNQTGLMALAGLVAGIGLIMLNVAGFFALQAKFGSPMAALIVAAANLVLAGILVSVAGRLSADDDVAPMTELRDMAIADIEAEVEGVAEEARELADNVRRIARDPMGSLLPSILGPLLGILLKGGKK